MRCAQIYDAAVRWLKYDVCNRKQYMVEVLGCVRFPLVSKTFLSKTVQAEPLIQDNPQCLKMVIGEQEESKTRARMYKFYISSEQNKQTKLPVTVSFMSMDKKSTSSSHWQKKGFKDVL